MLVCEHYNNYSKGVNVRQSFSSISHTLFIVSLLLFVGVTNATDFEHGHGAIQLFDKQGMENAPKWVQLWVLFMMLSFTIGLAFVWKHSTARWVVGGMIAGGITMSIAHRVIGLPLLSGFIALIHIIFWTPGLVLLLSRRPFMDSTLDAKFFKAWSLLITVVILFSFVFDFRDAFLYLQYLMAAYSKY